MIRWFIILCTIFLMLYTISYGDESKNSDLEKIGKDFYSMKNLGGNVAFLITEDGVVVIDAGTSLSAGKKILNTIRKKTDKPIRYLIVTHYHNDHILGVDAFPEDISVISSEKTKENISNITMKQRKINIERRYPEYIDNMKKKLENMEDKDSKEYKELKNQIKETEEFFKEYKNTKIVEPDITFKDRKTLEIGGEVLEIIHFPNTHTSGISIVYFKNRKTVHTSDLIFNKMFPYIDYEGGGNSTNWIDALEKIKKMDIDIVIPGHGNVENSKKCISKQIEYFKTMKKKIQNYVDKDYSVEKIKSELNLLQYKDYGKKRLYEQNIEAIYKEFVQN